MKFTRKEILNRYYCIEVGYCNLQRLLSKYNPIGYTCGTYGWNADIYVFGNVAIVTGYRAFGKHATYDICQRYNNYEADVNEFIKEIF